ncbi:Ribosome biogenesis ATPase rix7, partial [Coemansia spiralis]
MAGSNNKRPRAGGLVSELDRRVSRVIRDYMLEEQAATAGAVQVPATSALVEYVRGVDMGLRRNKTLQLEKSIERVLPGVRQQLDRLQQVGADDVHSSDDEPTLDGSARFDALEDVPTMEVADTNAMNGSLMRLWGARADSAAAAANTAALPAGESTEDSQGPCARPQPQQPPRTGAGSGTDARTARADGRERDGKKRRRAKAAPSATHAAPETRLADLGGVDACIEEVLELIVMPLKHPEIYMHTGVQPPRGVLLHGPPGCGKTMLANAIAGEVGVPFLQISAPSVVSGMSGESEKKIREVFEEARELAPCIVFIDEIDAITPKRENAQREMERRIVAQMLTCIDDLSWDKTDHRPVLLIGATNRPDSLDPALRRAGRFDREISMSVPDEDAREQILQ